MDNQKHTPGPWKVEHTFGEMIIRDSEDYPIAVIHGEDAIEESKYNAELIARAPELLQENERLKDKVIELQAEVDARDALRKVLNDEKKEMAKRIEELETKNKNQAELIERCIHPDRLPEYTKMLEGLLKRAEPYLARMETIDLNTEIKAALNL